MDFNLSNGASSMTDLRACTYTVECRGDELWMEFPGSPGDDYRLLGIRAVSEQFVNAPNTAATAVPSPTYDLVNEPPKTVASFARMVLLTSDPDLKVNLTRELVARFRNGQLKVVGLSTDPPPPDEPPRPASVRVVVPGKAPKIGKGGTVASRIKMLHALASIEQWAIDLALDVIARFWKWKVGSLDGQSGTKLPLAFFADHLQVALDEAKHFTLLRERMREIDGTQYGDLPVHHGLWESAHETRASLFSRLAIIGLVHESRGLDTNPRQISRCRAAGDHASADMLQIIHDDEITHVACGKSQSSQSVPRRRLKSSDHEYVLSPPDPFRRSNSLPPFDHPLGPTSSTSRARENPGHRHFTHLCTSLAPDPVDPVAQFKAEVRAHFYGGLRGPFNADDRARAGLDAAWYENLQGRRYGPGVVDGDEGEGGGARAGGPGSDAVTPSARGSTLSPTLSPAPPPAPAPDALDSRMQRLEIKV
jgi:uncharacterized ferritin-like protein (DUF455 family)